MVTALCTHSISAMTWNVYHAPEIFILHTSAKVWKSQRHNFSQTYNFSQIIKFGVMYGLQVCFRMEKNSETNMDMWSYESVFIVVHAPVCACMYVCAFVCVCICVCAHVCVKSEQSYTYQEWLHISHFESQFHFA